MFLFSKLSYGLRELPEFGLKGFSKRVEAKAISLVFGRLRARPKALVAHWVARYELLKNSKYSKRAVWRAFVGSMA